VRLLPAAVLLRVIPAILYFLPFYYLAGFRTGALQQAFSGVVHSY
jgi:hypothetical protein